MGRGAKGLMSRLSDGPIQRILYGPIQRIQVLAPPGLPFFSLGYDRQCHVGRCHGADAGAGQPDCGLLKGLKAQHDACREPASYDPTGPANAGRTACGLKAGGQRESHQQGRHTHPQRKGQDAIVGLPDFILGLEGASVHGHAGGHIQWHAEALGDGNDEVANVVQVHNDLHVASAECGWVTLSRHSAARQYSPAAVSAQHRIDRWTPAPSPGAPRYGRCDCQRAPCAESYAPADVQQQ